MKATDSRTESIHNDQQQSTIDKHLIEGNFFARKMLQTSFFFSACRLIHTNNFITEGYVFCKFNPVESTHCQDINKIKYCLTKRTEML